MPDIGNYSEITTLVLREGGKYFALLLMAVLAIRLWRRWSRTTTADKLTSGLLAGAATAAAAASGYFSMGQSLGKLYSYYGMEAFHAGRLSQAFFLFSMSAKFWNSPDALGQQGVCLLLSGNAGEGLHLLDEAKARRRDTGTPFEDFYEGLYYFTGGKTAQSIPLLTVAGAEPAYRWDVIKLFAVMELEANQTAEAETLMKPFLAADVTESDQAYIIASLRLAEGRTNEARAVLDKFPSGDLTPMWKTRFEKLQARMRN